MSDNIDNPVEASFEAWPEEREGLGVKFAKLALSGGALSWTPAAILKILLDQFGEANRGGRIQYLLDGIRAGFQVLESQIGADREKVDQVQARIDSPQFQQAVAAACEEAARATDEKKIQRLAAVLTGSITPSQWADPKADLAAMIRDIAELGTRDVEALDVLRTTFRDVVIHHPKLDDPNAFTEGMDSYRTAINLNGFKPEDFYAHCARLAGFGLAIEVVRNISRMHPNEYCFRPTRRGLALLDYLGRFGPSAS
jgi:hypothetical protein